jgi:hypothetical protein
MNNTNPPAARFWIALAGTCLVAAVAGNAAMAQDKAKPAAAPAKAAAKADAKADPKDQRDRKVLIDNDKVLVTEVGYKPGSASGMTERNQRVTRALTDGTLEKTFADGKKETITWKTGQVRFSPKETYSQKNIGKTELVLFTMSIK